MSQCANGYYTRAEFIDLLKYARSRGVRVIPEIETPGHARAAIVAMKNRAKNNPTAEQFRLWDDKNESVYTSARAITTTCSMWPAMTFTASSTAW